MIDVRMAQDHRRVMPAGPERKRQPAFVPAHRDRLHHAASSRICAPATRRMWQEPVTSPATCRCRRRDPHADRLAEHRLGRQLDGAGDAHRSTVPTKIDRPSDVTGLVGTSDRPKRLAHEDEVAAMEAIYRISKRKMDSNVSTGLPITRDQVVEEPVKCGYLDAAYTKEKFGNRVLNPATDDNIVGATGIFTDAEFNAGGADGNEFRKTASVMKMVLDGYAGAGCITMGGYDYHGGMRQEGETKDFRAGRCMGACLEYAARMGKPLMMYVFSDGSLSSNGVIDNSVAGRGKGEWTSDNQDTAAPFFSSITRAGARNSHDRGTDGRATSAARQLLGRRQRRACRHARRKQRQPARPDAAPELHGAERRPRPVRDPVPEPRPRRPRAARPAHRVRSDRLAGQPNRQGISSSSGSSACSLQRLLGHGWLGNVVFLPAGFSHNVIDARA